MWSSAFMWARRQSGTGKAHGDTAAGKGSVDGLVILAFVIRERVLFICFAYINTKHMREI